MKIGIFTNAYKPIISGVVNSIDLIKKGMRELGHKVYVFAPRYPGYRDREAGVFRFMSLNLSGQVKFPLAIPYSMRIYRIIDRLDLDIIHTHHPFILGELGAHFSRKLDIPLVYTFHTQFEQYTHYVPLPQDILKMAVGPKIVSYTEKCDQIICPSPTIMNLLAKYGVKKPVEMIPNAIDLAQFRNGKPESIRDKYGISPKEKILIYVGRIGVEKNLPFMLEAFKKILNRQPHCRLMIVGEGPEVESIEELKEEMSLGDRVILTGRVEYNQIPAYFRAGYAFLMTSTTEVKPLALLEAMASGLPVVAVKAAGSSDTVHSGVDGILTEQEVDSFAGAVQNLFDDEGLYKSLSDGARKTSSQYSIEITARRLEKVYRGLIRRKKKEFAL